MTMNNELRDKIAADIFVNSVADMKLDYIYNQVKAVADTEGKEIGTYLAESAIETANGFMEVLNKEKNKRVCG